MTCRWGDVYFRARTDGCIGGVGYGKVVVEAYGCRECLACAAFAVGDDYGVGAGFHVAQVLRGGKVRALFLPLEGVVGRAAAYGQGYGAVVAGTGLFPGCDSGGDGVCGSVNGQIGGCRTAVVVFCPKGVDAFGKTAEGGFRLPGAAVNAVFVTA